jgi:hypothetical protein
MLNVMHNQSNAVQEGMGRPTADTVQVTFRIPSHWLKEADAVAMVLSRHGMEATRTDAFREAIARGFKEIIKEASASQYRVSAWDGIRTTCLFWFGKEERDAVDAALRYAKDNRGGKWTIFRVYKDEPDGESVLVFEVMPGKTAAESVKNRSEALAAYADRQSK